MNLLKNKNFIWFVCNLPWLLITVLFFITPNFWKWSITVSGYTAALLLAICLMLAPLHRNFPSVLAFNYLNRRKREIGLSVFFYATWHVISYFIERYLSDGALPWIYLLHPVNIPGVIALIILLAMSLTSSNYAIKTMTYTKWKTLQRTVYIAEVCVFFHMILQFQDVYIWGLALFIPLFIIQRLRIAQNSSQ